MENALSIYFNEITDIPVLTKEQEKELGFKIKEGDEEAREKNDSFQFEACCQNSEGL